MFSRVKNAFKGDGFDANKKAFESAIYHLKNKGELINQALRYIRGFTDEMTRDPSTTELNQKNIQRSRQEIQRFEGLKSEQEATICELIGKMTPEGVVKAWDYVYEQRGCDSIAFDEVLLAHASLPTLTAIKTRGGKALQQWMDENAPSIENYAEIFKIRPDVHALWVAQIQGPHAAPIAASALSIEQKQETPTQTQKVLPAPSATTTASSSSLSSSLTSSSSSMSAPASQPKSVSSSSATPAVVAASAPLPNATPATSAEKPKTKESKISAKEKLITMMFTPVVEGDTKEEVLVSAIRTISSEDFGNLIMDSTEGNINNKSVTFKTALRTYHTFNVIDAALDKLMAFKATMLAAAVDTWMQQFNQNVFLKGKTDLLKKLKAKLSELVVLEPTVSTAPSASASPSSSSSSSSSSSTLSTSSISIAASSQSVLSSTTVPSSTSSTATPVTAPAPAGTSASASAAPSSWIALNLILKDYSSSSSSSSSSAAPASSASSSASSSSVTATASSTKPAAESSSVVLSEEEQLLKLVFSPVPRDDKEEAALVEAINRCDHERLFELLNEEETRSFKGGDPLTFSDALGLHHSEHALDALFKRMQTGGWTFNFPEGVRDWETRINQNEIINVKAPLISQIPPSRTFDEVVFQRALGSARRDLSVNQKINQDKCLIAHINKTDSQITEDGPQALLNLFPQTLADSQYPFCKDIFSTLVCVSLDVALVALKSVQAHLDTVDEDQLRKYINDVITGAQAGGAFNKDQEKKQQLLALFPQSLVGDELRHHGVSVAVPPKVPTAASSAPRSVSSPPHVPTSIPAGANEYQNEDVHKKNRKWNIKKILKDHFDRNKNRWRWFFGVVMTVLVLALVFSSLGGMVLPALPFIGMALQSAATWAASSVAGGFAAVGVSLVAGFLVGNLERLLVLVVHPALMLLKAIVSPIATLFLFASVHLNAWARGMKVGDAAFGEQPLKFKDGRLWAIQFFSGLAWMIIAGPAFILGFLSKGVEMLRSSKLVHTAAMLWRGLGPKVDQINVPSVTPQTFVARAKDDGITATLLSETLDHTTEMFTWKKLVAENCRDMPAPTLSPK